LPKELEAQLRQNLVSPALHFSAKNKERSSYEKRSLLGNACEFLPPLKTASFYKVHSNKVGGFFISANPSCKLSHLSIWQNNQENVVPSVPAVLSRSQSTSHFL